MERHNCPTNTNLIILGGSTIRKKERKKNSLLLLFFFFCFVFFFGFGFFCSFFHFFFFFGRWDLTFHADCPSSFSEKNDICLSAAGFVHSMRSRRVY